MWHPTPGSWWTGRTRSSGTRKPGWTRPPSSSPGGSCIPHIVGWAPAPRCSTRSRSVRPACSTDIRPVGSGTRSTRAMASRRRCCTPGVCDRYGTSGTCRSISPARSRRAPRRTGSRSPRSTRQATSPSSMPSSSTRSPTTGVTTRSRSIGGWRRRRRVRGSIPRCGSWRERARNRSAHSPRACRAIVHGWTTSRSGHLTGDAAPARRSSGTRSRCSPVPEWTGCW